MGVTFVFFLEVNYVSWFGGTLLQVPDLEVFALVYSEELTYTCSESLAIIIRGFDAVS